MEKLVSYYVWNIGSCGSETCEKKEIGAAVFGELRNLLLEENGEDTMVREITNEQVLDHIGKKKTLLDNILRRKANWISHILRRNCLLHDVIEGQMTEVKGVKEEYSSLII